jgi:hypothetical protein
MNDSYLQYVGLLAAITVTLDAKKTPTVKIRIPRVNVDFDAWVPSSVDRTKAYSSTITKEAFSALASRK